MLQQPDTLSRIRSVTMGATGAVRLLYAGMAAVTGQPSPMPAWIPGLFGIATAIVITLSCLAAGRTTARRAHDEFYRAQDHLAQRIGYWCALALYPLAGLLMAQDIMSLRLAMPIMGTLTGAAYLIPHAILTWRTE